MIKNPHEDENRLKKYIIIGVILAILGVFNYFALTKHVSSNSQFITDVEIEDEDMNKNRNPAVAGLFYSGDKKLLSDEVEHYLSVDYEAKNLYPEILIVPHAGYQYSASVAAKAYLQLQHYKDKIKRVVLVGPSHRVGFKGVAVSTADTFSTPLGKVKLSKKMREEVLKNAEVIELDAAHKDEHSIEVQLPFLQKTLDSFTILPLVYGDIEPENLAKILESFVDKKGTVIIFSADLSHYHDYDTANKIDAGTAGLVENKLPLDDHMSCGATGINAALILARTKHLRPELLDMANSGDQSGDLSKVVGYGSWMFGQNDEPEAPLSPIETEVKNLKSFAGKFGNDLINIAQRSIEEAVGNHHYSPSRSDYDDNLFNKGSSFVTLTKNGDLRGCIGTIVPHQSISYDIANNAYAAAMEDSRFHPLTAEELSGLQISISLLTDFEAIKFVSEENLLSQVNEGLDGLILRDGNRQGVLLPSVWKTIPDKQEFLQQLKLKAGLAPSYWSNKIKIYRFRTVEVKKDED